MDQGHHVRLKEHIGGHLGVDKSDGDEVDAFIEETDRTRNIEHIRLRFGVGGSRRRSECIRIREIFTSVLLTIDIENEATLDTNAHFKRNILRIGSVFERGAEEPVS